MGKIDTMRSHLNRQFSGDSRPLLAPKQSASRSLKKQVRIVKKVRGEDGVWRFVSLDRIGSRYVWDDRPGHYFVEWWDGTKRCRQLAGSTPGQAKEGQRRKRNELIGELALNGRQFKEIQEEGTVTRISDAIGLFTAHIITHSPAKPRTLERYREVLAHFERLTGRRKYVEAISRSDIDDYKNGRRKESVDRWARLVSPSPINF